MLLLIVRVLIGELMISLLLVVIGLLGFFGVWRLVGLLLIEGLRRIVVVILVIFGIFCFLVKIKISVNSVLCLLTPLLIVNGFKKYINN